MKVKMFSLSRYIEEALKRAEYERDETGMIVAWVPGASGFFTQGETFEEAREMLKDAIEGNVMFALQLGWDIPRIGGVNVEECEIKTTQAPRARRKAQKARV